MISKLNNTLNNILTSITCFMLLATTLIFINSNKITCDEYIDASSYICEEVSIDQSTIEEPKQIDQSIMEEVKPKVEEPKPEVIEKAPAPVVEQPKKTINDGIYPNITKSSGTYNYGGRRYTYYSSNTMPHYLIGKGHRDARGFGHDSDGYFVIAYTMNLPYGTVVDLGNGCLGKVGDHCPTKNTVDLYVSG